MKEARKWLVEKLFEYLDPLVAHYSDGCARLLLAGGGAQYEQEVLSMEAWARQLWGLAPFWAGGGRSRGGRFEAIYARGLANGTDPGSHEYWGGCRDHDQRFVEMGAIGYALLLAPDVLWEPLTPEERQNVAEWLSKINRHTCPPGNWLWFQALVNLALKELNMPYSKAVLQDDLQRLDGFYLGNGWYQDGPTGVCDYYNAMTFHFFSLFYASRFGKEVPGAVADATKEGADATAAARAAHYLQRAHVFAGDYLGFFSARGEGVPYGRSMTYRFAQAGFWSMAFACGVNLGKRFSPATLLGLTCRNIAAWDARRICDNGGVQTIGYHYPNLHMAEGYNGPGSPYWSLMAFACLARPASDAVWSECGIADDDQEEDCLAGSLNHLLSGHLESESTSSMGIACRGADGEVTLYPSGCVPGHPFAQSDCKYSKFAYSSRFGFSVSRSRRSIEEAAPDSMLAFVINGQVFVRDGVREHKVVKLTEGLDALGVSALDCSDALFAKTCLTNERTASTEQRVAMYSRWSPWEGIEVWSLVVPLTNGHARLHRVKSKIACDAYDCGFAVPGDYHYLMLADAERLCSVRGLDARGFEHANPYLIRAEANTNITFPKTVIPAVRYRIPVGEVLLGTLISS